jgi:hypothetical protein
MIVLVANIYMMANLSHPNDTKFGKSWIARIFVYVGAVLVQLPVIFVFQDVNANKHINILSKEDYILNNGTDLVLDKVHTEFGDVWLY